MKFFVPTNWDDKLIEALDKDFVSGVYGKLASDCLGGGRPSCVSPHISRRKIAVYINKIHKKGIPFNYLANSLCLDNNEWTIRGQRNFRKLFDWLTKVNVDSVTVANAYLLEWIKKNYTSLKVNVSTIAGVNSIARAKYWEEIGADKITLSISGVSRNLRLISKIREAVKCDLQLIANLDCLYNCPFEVYHNTLASHGSQTGHRSKGFFINYCYLYCRYKQWSNPMNIIRGGWIRPEDVKYYEAIGINSVKLVDRNMTTEGLLRIITAYKNEKYDGNLMDLFPNPSKNIMSGKINFFHNIKYFFHPFSVNIFKLIKGRQFLIPHGIYIDNRALDGFIEHFLKGKCEGDCKECGYCENIANTVVKIDEESRQKTIKKYEDYISDIESGRIFRFIN